jgi:hypothetical protein
MTHPLADPIAEAQRLLGMARDHDLTVRLLGGVAVAMRAGGNLPAPLARAYKDLDVVTLRKDAPRFNALLADAGYVPDEQFNALHGAQRLLHFDPVNGKQLDTFVDTFAMCHELDLRTRLPTHGATLSPADLLLTKLQIVEVNDKDLIDTVALVLTHPVARDGDDVISLDALCAVLGSDWGWHTTLTDNLAKVASRLATLDLEDDPKRLVAGRVEELAAAIAGCPKSMRWKMRAKIGRRMPWYDLPEEV